MPKRKLLKKNRDSRFLLYALVIALLSGLAYLLLNLEDIVGQATEAVGAPACEQGKFYLASDGTLELCNCVGSSCARGSCEGAVCKKTKQITINPNGGKVTVRDPVSSSTEVIDVQKTFSLDVGAQREISLNPQQPSATAGVDLVFTGWNDGADATTTSRVIVVTQDATYTPNWKSSKYMLSVSKVGAGTIITSTGINCGLVCSYAYYSGQVVVLTATPSIGSVFARWSGACSGTSTTCTVTVDSEKSVTAEFLSTSPTLNQGLALLLSMNEPLGQIKDSSGNNNDVKEYGTTATIYGKIGSARSFAGAGYIIIADSPSLQLKTPFSVAFWIKSTQITGYSGTMLFYKGKADDFSSISYAGKASSDPDRKKLEFFTNLGTTTKSLYESSADTFLFGGYWHFLTFVYDGAALHVYQDAVLKSSFSTPANAPVYPAVRYPLTIGGQWLSAFDNFNGIIDEFAVWNRALSSDEINQLFNNAQGFALS